VANREFRLGAISPDGGCLRLLLSQAQLLRAGICLFFQQRLKESSLADFAEDIASPPACFKKNKSVASAGNSLSAIPEDANEMQDCHDECPADAEAKADERIRVALEVLLEHALGVSQGTALLANEGPNLTAAGASIISNCIIH